MSFQGIVQQLGKLVYCRDPDSHMSRHITFNYYHCCVEIREGWCCSANRTVAIGTSESKVLNTKSNNSEMLWWLSCDLHIRHTIKIQCTIMK